MQLKQIPTLLELFLFDWHHVDPRPTAHARMRALYKSRDGFKQMWEHNCHMKYIAESEPVDGFACGFHL